MKKLFLDQFTAVILAAGKGTRMNSQTAKVLIPLNDKPLIFYILENLDKAGCRRFVIVVGYKGDEVKESIEKAYSKTIYKKCHFVYQKEQLGTGHAVLCAETLLKPKPIIKTHRSENFLVVAGDMPLLKANTFKKLFNYHIKNKNTVTVLTAEMEKPFGYGRVLLNNEGNIYSIVEEKDASPKEKTIKEVNTGTYIFQNDKGFHLLKQIGSQNAQGEYYLPDMVSLALKYNYKVSHLSLKNSFEARGVNTQTELLEIEQSLNKIKLEKKRNRLVEAV